MKVMAPHSSTLAWKIPWTEEPGGLQFMGSQRVGHDWVTSLSFRFHALEKEMATHSSVLAWRIPGTGRASWTAVSGVAQSQTQLKRLSSIEKEGFPGGSMGKEFACSAGDTGDTSSVPGLGRFPGRWHDSPLHYSCLENSMGRVAW